MHEFGFVRRRHHHHVRQDAEEADVERSGVSRPIGADEAGPVDGEAHGEILDRDVMHDLIVTALKEGRIEGAERLEAFGGEAGGEGHRMLFGDADIEGALRERLLEDIEPRAARHGGGDREILSSFCASLTSASANTVV